jgi:hypothetical protein
MGTAYPRRLELIHAIAAWPLPIGTWHELVGIGQIFLARRRVDNRWCKSNMDVSDDADYVQTLDALLEASVRCHFSPYTPRLGCVVVPRRAERPSVGTVRDGSTRTHS